MDDLEILRRAHAPPDRRKLRKLTEFVRELGIHVDSLENRFEIQQVVQQVRGATTEYAVNYAILKSMSKAVYQPDLEIHYALNFDHYCHFTSPIRRYPDLQVHRTVQRLITDQPPYGDPIPVLINLGHQCSDLEQNAEWAERELIKVKLLHFLNKKVGETMPGVISGVVPDGFYVRGTQFPAEGFVSVSTLPDDRYRFEKHGHMLEGFRGGNRFRLGDELTVRIHAIDLPRRTLLLTVVTNHTARSSVAPSPRLGGGRTRDGKQSGKPTSKRAGRKAKRRRR